jgi:hypothetical protein
MFVRLQFTLALATRSRSYTNKTRLRGFRNPDFWLVRLIADFVCVVANYIRPKLLKLQNSPNYLLIIYGKILGEE